MEFWPKSSKRLKRISVFLLFITVSSLAIFYLIFSWYKILVVSPPCTTVSNRQIDSSAPVCLQQTGNSGWTVFNNLLRVSPRCLTVMNSRFGSRFNLDWYTASQKITSGLLGTLEDQNSGLSLSFKSGDKYEPIFPLLSNNSFIKQTVDLGLTYQQINFENQEFIISLKITSPFSPSKSIEDENTKLSSAPFFYLDLLMINKTNRPQSQTLIFSLNKAKKISSYQSFELIEFADGVRKDGKIVLAKKTSQSEIKTFVERNQGGFYWQTNLAPGSSAKTRFVYAGYLEGSAITDNSQSKINLLKFAYQKWFDDVEQVVEYALNNQDNIIKSTQNFENRIQNQNLLPQQRWLLAQAFHSYIGNTWLMIADNTSNDSQYFVWEGEFKYLNTLDVAHDYAVLEGLYFPWVLKSELELWQKNAKKDEKGVVIPHDLGARFNYRGASAYGIDGAATSGMPVEENTNFILLSYWYYQQTKDKQFIKQLSGTITDLSKSLIARDTNQNGIADQVIRMTTYDNDGNSALSQGPDNSYLGVKQLSAYLAAGEIFKLLKMEEESQVVFEQAKLIVKSLKEVYQQKGFIPLSLDPNFQEKNQFDGKTIKGIDEQGFAFIIGLFYPALTDLRSDLLTEIKPLLAESYRLAYEKSLIKNEKKEIVGLQLAQYQSLALGWFSHSVMADFIAGKLFNQQYQSWKIYFPLLFDNPYSFADGQYFKKPFYPPQTTLIFYPRGAALFSVLK